MSQILKSCDSVMLLDLVKPCIRIPLGISGCKAQMQNLQKLRKVGRHVLHGLIALLLLWLKTYGAIAVLR